MKPTGHSEDPVRIMTIFSIRVIFCLLRKDSRTLPKCPRHFLHLQEVRFK